MSQCYQQRLSGINKKLKFVNEYNKEVALPYHGMKL